MSDRDYYEILGLTPAADGAMVDQAYWHLARKYQSLATTNPRASQMLDELNEAYGVIGSPKLREHYDGFRDDVLISKGMIKPVESNPKRNARPRSSDAAAPRRLPTLSIRLPELGGGHWRTSAAGGLVTALAVAGATQGISPIFVIGALVAAVALALTPVLRRRLADVSLPAVVMPELRTPRVVMPRSVRGTAPRTHEASGRTLSDDPPDADELHASTAAMISRWRSSVGLRPLPTPGEPRNTPSTTLVDIVESEREVSDQGEPLAAVIDILRGAHRSAEYR
jgi:hypothetical protein